MGMPELGVTKPEYVPELVEVITVSNPPGILTILWLAGAGQLMTDHPTLPLPLTPGCCCM
jgi:hypothetical protein